MHYKVTGEGGAADDEEEVKKSRAELMVPCTVRPNSDIGGK